MIEDIQEVIKKNLPELAAAELLKVLTKAKDDTRLLTEQANSLKSAREENKRLSDIGIDYDEVVRKQEVVAKQVAELAKLENTLELRRVAYELATEKNKNVFLENLLGTLVRNPDFRKSTLTNFTNRQEYSSQGSYNVPVSECTTETTSEI